MWDEHTTTEPRTTSEGPEPATPSEVQPARRAGSDRMDQPPRKALPSTSAVIAGSPGLREAPHSRSGFGWCCRQSGKVGEFRRAGGSRQGLKAGGNSPGSPRPRCPDCCSRSRRARRETRSRVALPVSRRRIDYRSEIPGCKKFAAALRAARDQPTRGQCPEPQCSGMGDEHTTRKPMKSRLTGRLP